MDPYARKQKKTTTFIAKLNFLLVSQHLSLDTWSVYSIIAHAYAECR